MLFVYSQVTTQCGIDQPQQPSRHQVQPLQQQQQQQQQEQRKFRNLTILPSTRYPFSNPRCYDDHGNVSLSCHLVYLPSMADLGLRVPCVPSQSDYFHFHAVFGKNYSK